LTAGLQAFVDLQKVWIEAVDHKQGKIVTANEQKHRSQEHEDGLDREQFAQVFQGIRTRKSVLVGQGGIHLSAIA
jgi:hypothetical protein